MSSGWLDEGREFGGRFAGAPLPRSPGVDQVAQATMPPVVADDEVRAFERFVAAPDMALAGFIVWDTFQDVEDTMADNSLAEFGYAVAGSTELVVASVARGDWGEEAEQRAYYVDSFRQWLDSDDVTAEERERIRNGYFLNG